MSVFEENIAGHKDWEQSFIGQLMENSYWDKDQFWKLHAEITNFSREIATWSHIPRHYSAKLSRIIFLIGIKYSAHLDKMDVVTIKGIEDEELRNFMERVECLTMTYFEAKFPEESSFFISNPYLKDA